MFLNGENILSCSRCTHVRDEHRSTSLLISTLTCAQKLPANFPHSSWCSFGDTVNRMAKHCCVIITQQPKQNIAFTMLVNDAAVHSHSLRETRFTRTRKKDMGGENKIAAKNAEIPVEKPVEDISSIRRSPRRPPQTPIQAGCSTRPLGPGRIAPLPE